MNIKKDDIVKLNGGIEYLVVDIIDYNSNKYLYLARMDVDEFNLVKLDYKENQMVFTSLNEDEYSQVIAIMSKQMLNDN